MTSETPLAIGSVVELTLDRLGSGGEAVGRSGGMVVFVEGGAPGEVAKVRITERKERFARGRVTEVVQASPERIEPPCPHHFQVLHTKCCGGCSWQHLPYESQLAAKQQIVRDALSRVGGLKTADVLPVIGMKDPWRYRNKVQQPVLWKEGKFYSGFYASGSHDLIDIDDCLVQPELSVRIIRRVRQLLEKHGIRDRWIRHFLVRTSQNGAQASLTFVTWIPEFPKQQEIVGTLLQEFSELKSVFQNVNGKETNVILGPQWRKIAGPDTIEEKLGNTRFQISPAAFFQVNTLQAEELVEEARKSIHREVETLIDAYCGVGTFALALADRFRRVIGIEEVAPAVKDAIQNSRLNQVSNVTFMTGKVEAVLPRVIRGSKVPGLIANACVLLDPPRAGCSGSVVQTLIHAKPRQILYVSCDPATLARDLGMFCDKGYSLESVQPVDLFPHTPHIECVASLRRIPPTPSLPRQEGGS